MSGIMDVLGSQLSGGMLEQLSSQIGADKSKTASAVSAAIPILIGGLAKNALSSKDGAASLAGALERDHDGSVLDSLPGLLGSLSGDRNRGGLGGLLGAATAMLGGSSNKATDGGAILGHILGGQRHTVESGISKASGLDMSQVAKLLPLLAPIVMGALGKLKRQQNLDAGALAELLGKERETLHQSNPSVMAGLTSMLDADNDGSVLDDLARLGGKGLFGKLFKKE